MRAELRHLHVVLAVAAAGSIRRAATDLKIAQPGLTAQIRRIERTFGGQLFVRASNGVVLTELGEHVVLRAQEIVEKFDDLCATAGELGLIGVPAFMFQEGDDAVTERAFREIARLSRGAYCRFTPGAAHELAELLRAAAAYAAGGLKALSDLSARHGAGAAKLLKQMS